MSYQDVEVDSKLSVRHQCRLMNLSHSGYYYKPVKESSEDLILKDEILHIHWQTPFYGVRRIKVKLNQKGYKIGRKKIRRIMQELEISAIYPKKRLSTAVKEHEHYPYLLKDMAIERVNQVHSTDITYIKLPHQFAYLTVVMDWRSRYILSWRLSHNLKKEFCISALQESLSKDIPEYFNIDQGGQFTNPEYLSILKQEDIKISMDSKGRCFDNILVERFWRNLKYEDIYIKDYQNFEELEAGISEYIEFYNYSRPHQSLNYKTPYEVYIEGKNEKFDKVS